MPLIVDEKFGVLHLWNRISGEAGACVSSTGGCDVKEIENARFHQSLHSQVVYIGDADMAKKSQHMIAHVFGDFPCTRAPHPLSDRIHSKAAR